MQSNLVPYFSVYIYQLDARYETTCFLFDVSTENSLNLKITPAKLF